MTHWDVCIVGAGVIGLALARSLSQSGRQVIVLEQHQQVGQETSSRNSEVIHAGLYYPTNSLKARLCVEGKALLYNFCQHYGVAHRRVGKLIVATEHAQLAALDALARKAVDNGVNDLEPVSAQQLAELEPAVNAVAGLWSPSTGIIDSHAFMQVLSAQIEQAGGLIACGTVFQHAEPTSQGFEIVVASQGEPFRFSASALINSAGLHAPSVASRITSMPDHQIPALHYCKGVYFSWQGKPPFQHLIYPVADADSAGLGIHATLDLSGQVRFGPDTQYVDELDYHADEARRDTFVQAIARYFPAVQAERLTPAYAGIRPKLQAAGAPFADFQIQTAGQHGINSLVNLFGFESPGLTSALALAEQWRSLFGEEFLA